VVECFKVIVTLTLQMEKDITDLAKRSWRATSPQERESILNLISKEILSDQKRSLGFFIFAL
jgi:acyl-CoA reductase-like NAD-dependent aldehyde dehydrogenase